MKHFDTVIVGARCAGAALALLLARAGARVLVLEKGRHGTDTLSTHALMRGAILQLTRWNLLPAIVSAGTPPIRWTLFRYGTKDVNVEIEPRFGVDALYAPRRTVLDRVLVDAAMESGAEFQYGAHVHQATRDTSGRVRGVTFSIDGNRESVTAGVIVGADGLYSTVAHEVGAATLTEGRHATGVLYSYWDGLAADRYQWHYSSDASVGIIPTNAGAACVFASVPSARFREEVRGDTVAAYQRLIRRASPQFADSLQEHRRVERVRGFAGLPGYIRRGHGPGWVLVGDAAYFKDPLTAHGITDALRDAELLARALMTGSDRALAEYDIQRQDLSRGLFDVTDEIASFSWTEERLQTLHRSLSKEMSREVRMLAGLEPDDACSSRSASVA